MEVGQEYSGSGRIVTWELSQFTMDTAEDMLELLTTTRCRDGVTVLLLLLSYNTDTGNSNRTEKNRQEKWSLPSCASSHPGSHSAGR